MCIWYSHYTKWDRYTQRTHIHIFISQTTNDTYLAWIRNSEHYVGIVFIVVWTRKNIHSVHLFFPQRIHTYLPLPCPGYLCLFLWSWKCYNSLLFFVALIHTASITFHPQRLQNTYLPLPCPGYLWLFHWSWKCYNSLLLFCCINDKYTQHPSLFTHKGHM